jgi:predicted secreted protein
MSQQFGYAGYSVREVAVATNESGNTAILPMLRAKAMAASADEALPTEAGKADVTATVNGSVQMLR